MLQYLNQGYRTLGENPILPHARLNWEFYAVVEGRCAPVLPGSAERPLQSRQLWVFPPEMAHGWRGEPNKQCRVFCFHFAHVLPPLDTTVRSNSFHAAPLSKVELTRLVQIGQELKQHFEKPTNFTHLRFQKSLVDLTVMAAKNIKETALPELSLSINRKVDMAITWYQDHYSEFPTLEQVAAKVNVSASYLRKIFMQVRKESPMAVFQRMRLQHAMELLSESGLKLEVISTRCGYANCSDFCRAFKRELGVSPNKWRRNDYSTVANAQAKPLWRGRESWDLKRPF